MDYVVTSDYIPKMQIRNTVNGVILIIYLKDIISNNIHEKISFALSSFLPFTKNQNYGHTKRGNGTEKERIHLSNKNKLGTDWRQAKKAGRNGFSIVKEIIIIITTEFIWIREYLIGDEIVKIIWITITEWARSLIRPHMTLRSPI